VRTQPVGNGSPEFGHAVDDLVGFHVCLDPVVVQPVFLVEYPGSLHIRIGVVGVPAPWMHGHGVSEGVVAGPGGIGVVAATHPATQVCDAGIVVVTEIAVACIAGQVEFSGQAPDDVEGTVSSQQVT